MFKKTKSLYEVIIEYLDSEIELRKAFIKKLKQ